MVIARGPSCALGSWGFRGRSFTRVRSQIGAIEPYRVPGGHPDSTVITIFPICASLSM
jgi:hypothetical protein